MQITRVRPTMERERYEVPLQNLIGHLIAKQVPENSVIHYWYEESTPARKVETKKSKNWKSQMMGVAGIWSDYDNAQEDFAKIRSSFNRRIDY